MKLVACKELRELSQEQLMQKIDEMKRQLLELRLNAIAKHIADFASAKKVLRVSIARALTVKQERQTIR